MRCSAELDIFFANAGVAHASPLAETDERLYDEMMDINIKGLLLDAGGLADPPRGGSVILNTSFINQVGFPGLSVLAASKAAVRSSLLVVAELLDRKIRVNAVSWEQSTRRSGGQSSAALQRRVRRRRKAQFPTLVPVGRLEDVGGDCQRGDPVPLASDASAHRRRLGG